MNVYISGFVPEHVHFFVFAELISLLAGSSAKVFSAERPGYNQNPIRMSRKNIPAVLSITSLIFSPTTQCTVTASQESTESN